jgi:hypothetical protein
MKKSFNEDYNYMVDTYNYPIDKDIIEKKFGNYSLDINDLWLVKTKNQCGGNGIKFLETLKKIDMTEFLISKYIPNLDLINKKKYDLRLFILISGLRPLRIYFYQEGIVRIATKNYSINYKDIHNKFMYLTNYNVNSKSKNFVVPNETNIEEANIWNLQIYSDHLKRKNVDYNSIMTKIEDIIIKSTISVYQNLTLELSQNNLDDINFYDILGYDIIIKDNYEPILLEINKSPEKTFHSHLS